MADARPLKTIAGREQMNTENICPACGKPFSMGETIVLANGPWKGGPQYVHEKDANYDTAGCCYHVKDKLR